jgi:hypothetical protein
MAEREMRPSTTGPHPAIPGVVVTMRSSPNRESLRIASATRMAFFDSDGLQTGCGFFAGVEFVCEPRRDWVCRFVRSDRLKSGFLGMTDDGKSIQASDPNEFKS